MNDREGTVDRIVRLALIFAAVAALAVVVYVVSGKTNPGILASRLGVKQG